MKSVLRISFLAIATALVMTAHSCDMVHEFPGGGGVDPTEISADIRIIIPQSDMPIDTVVVVKSAPAIDIKKETTDKYDRRFFVEVHNGEYNSDIVASYALTRPSSDTSDVVINTILHARKYVIMVWMDYVLKGDSTDLYFHTGDGSAMTSITILDRKSYVAGTDFKNSQHCLSNIDLTSYAGRWHSQVTIDAPLYSPMAKIRFYANDLEKYAESISWPHSLDSLARCMHVEFVYNGYLPTGFNAMTGRLNDSDVGYGFNHNCYYPERFRGTDYALVGSDIVFVNGETSSVNVSALIRDSEGTVIREVNNINVPIHKGKETVIIYKFFTKEYVPGIGINPDFDGEFNVYV